VQVEDGALIPIHNSLPQERKAANELPWSRRTQAFECACRRHRPAARRPRLRPPNRASERAPEALQGRDLRLQLAQRLVRCRELVVQRVNLLAPRSLELLCVCVFVCARVCVCV
jgi:hypothetical protein